MKRNRAIEQIGNTEAEDITAPERDLRVHDARKQIGEHDAV